MSSLPVGCLKNEGASSNRDYWGLRRHGLLTGHSLTRTSAAIGLCALLVTVGIYLGDSSSNCAGLRLVSTYFGKSESATAPPDTLTPCPAHGPPNGQAYGPPNGAPTIVAIEPSPANGTYRWYHPWEDWAMPAARWMEGRRRKAEKEKKVRRQWLRRSLTVTYSEEAEAEFMTMLHEVQFPRTCGGPILLMEHHLVGGILSNIHQTTPWLEMAVAMKWTLVPAATNQKKFGLCDPPDMSCFFNFTHCFPHMPLGRSRAEEFEAAYRTKPAEDRCGIKDYRTTELHLTGGKLGPVVNVGPKAALCEQAKAWRRKLIGEWIEKGWLRRENGEALRSVKCLGETEQLYLMYSLIMRFTMTVTDRVRVRARDLLSKQKWRPPVVAIKVRRGDHLLEDIQAKRCGGFLPLTAHYETLRFEETSRGYPANTIVFVTDDSTAYDEFMAVLAPTTSREGDAKLAGQQKSVALVHAGKDAENATDEDVEQTVPVVIYDDPRGALAPANLTVDSHLDYVANIWLVGEIADYAIGLAASNGGRAAWEVVGANHRLVQQQPSGPAFVAVDENVVDHYFYK